MCHCQCRWRDAACPGRFDPARSGMGRVCCSTGLDREDHALTPGHVRPASRLAVVSEGRWSPVLFSKSHRRAALTQHATGACHGNMSRARAGRWSSSGRCRGYHMVYLVTSTSLDSISGGASASARAAKMKWMDLAPCAHRRLAGGLGLAVVLQTVSSGVVCVVKRHDTRSIDSESLRMGYRQP